jgi:hypothetical protein
MAKVYRYSVRPAEWAIGLPSLVLTILVGAMFFAAGLRLDELADQLVALGLGLLFLLGGLSATILLFVRHVGAIHIAVADKELIIKNAFTTRFINWEDITEFGTYRRVGPHYPVRVFYVKTKACPDQQIRVGNQFLEEVDSFIDEVFRRATNARFLRIENNAYVPFTKKLRSLPWERNSQTWRA